MLNIYKKLILLLWVIAATSIFQICSGESSTPLEGSIASPLYNLKGTYQVVSDKYKPLSLLNGAIAWETGYIEKLLTDKVMRKSDDPTTIDRGPVVAKLCNYLFTYYPSPAQGFPSALGIRKLFVGDDQTIDDRAAKRIADCVAKVLHNIDKIRKVLSKSNDVKVLLKNVINKVTPDKKVTIVVEKKSKEQEAQKEVAEVSDKCMECGKDLEGLSHCGRNVKVTNTNERGTQIKMLALCVMKVVSDSYFQKPTLEPNTAEMILLAFIYRALGHHKGYIKYFYNELNRLLNKEFLMLPRARSVFARYPTLAYEMLIKGAAKIPTLGYLLDRVSSLPVGWELTRYKSVTPARAKREIETLLSQAPTNDYQRIVATMWETPKKDCTLFAEDLVFYASQLSYIPKPNSPAWATYEVSATKDESEMVKTNVSFFDTMGNAVRNFIRLLSYDSTRQKFSWQKLQKQFPKMSKELIDYLKVYESPGHDDTPEAHSRWAQLMADKDYILYKHTFVLEESEGDEETDGEWAMMDNVVKIQARDKENIIEVRFKAYGFDGCSVKASSQGHGAEMMPFVINGMLMLHYLLGSPESSWFSSWFGSDKAKEIYDLFNHPEKLFPPSAEPFGCLWKLSYLKQDGNAFVKSDLTENDFKNFSQYVLLSGSLKRFETSWGLWSRQVEGHDFSVVTTPHYGAFTMTKDSAFYSQKTALDPDDINYTVTPALKLLMEKLVPKEEQAEERK